jgi:NADPH:quinone reductase-like Zn-dependent oxidoreductase
MKAAIVTRYGARGAIEVREAPKPAPGPGEVLVRVRAATVNRTDCGELRNPVLTGLIAGRGGRRRTILGMDVAGEVEAVGAGVSRFKPGDRIFGMSPLARDGAQAEYVCLSETAPIAEIPVGLRFDEAVVCEGSYYASGSITAFGLKPGHRILIYGASGAIGSAAVQLAKHRGAEVTAVVATDRLEMARSLGADRVVDYATPEFRELGMSYDFVLDAVGKMTARRWRPLLKPDGVFATTDIGPGGQSLRLLLWSLVTRSGRVTVPVPRRGSAPAFVDFLKARMEAGEFRAVVDRHYPLVAIADAYRYVQTGQKAGIVVIDV